VEERGIEYGFLFVTSFFFNSLDCLYIKKDCEFLQSYEKTSEVPKENLFFFALLSESNFGIANVMKKACNEEGKHPLKYTL